MIIKFIFENEADVKNVGELLKAIDYKATIEQLTLGVQIDDLTKITTQVKIASKNPMLKSVIKKFI